MRSLMVLLPLLMLAACDKQSTQEEQAQPAAIMPDLPEKAQARIDRSHAGEAAPTEAFLDPDGQSVTLASFRGTPLIVNLWATWCAPCLAEMPTLDRLAGAAKGRYHLIVVSQDMAGKRAVDPYFAKAGFATLKPYLDKQNALMLALKSETLPTTIFYDPTGREVWRVIGAMDWEGAEASRLIDQAIDG